VKLHTTSGFTLVELMIALAVLGILVAIAYPGYLDQLRKSRRAEGMAALLELAERMERHFADQGTYDQHAGGADMDAATVWKNTTVHGHYHLSIDAGTSTLSFTARATPTGKNGQDRDPCGTFVINAQGIRSLDTTNGGARPDTGYRNGDCWR
jgi:type IV pilus assembly protein PilE